jgi:type IV pilus assembly protein PilB
MIGEIRDAETIQIAIKAALTGHLVFSTLHTNSSAESIIRVADMGIPAYLIASTLILISAQRLGRKLCLQCREPLPEVPMDKLMEVGFKPDDFNEDFTIYRHVGCKLCKGAGYRGRFAILETMPLTEKLRRMIVDGANTLDIHDTAVDKEGMLSLHRVGILNVLRGVTDIENLLKTTRTV